MILILISFFACNQTQPCPDDMVSFDKITFKVGVEKPTRSWHTGAQEVTVEPFCMDQYEYPNVKGEYPTHSVTWEEAKSMCEAVGKRLCSSAEWELACRGTEGRMYSYGQHRNRNMARKTDLNLLGKKLFSGLAGSLTKTSSNLIFSNFPRKDYKIS